MKATENNEVDWLSDFNRFEHFLHEKVEKTSKFERGEKREKTETWFCKQFQKQEGCPKEKSHWGKINGKDKYLQHIRASCLLKDKTKNQHSESSAKCPHKEQ